MVESLEDENNRNDVIQYDTPSKVEVLSPSLETNLDSRTPKSEWKLRMFFPLQQHIQLPAIHH